MSKVVRRYTSSSVILTSTVENRKVPFPIVVTGGCQVPCSSRQYDDNARDSDSMMTTCSMLGVLQYSRSFPSQSLPTFVGGDRTSTTIRGCLRNRPSPASSSLEHETTTSVR